ncbi:small multi-drug export protein [Candidatus Peregrinibacteria bacterium]|nr:small multi-drug export protein [Candidatus Peregrinibacteria bacterium]
MINFYPYLWTFFGSMLPIIELRGAIPVAIEKFGLSAGAAYVLAVLGCVVPALILLKILGPVSDWLMKKSDLMRRVFTAIFDHTRRTYTNKIYKFGILLVLLVAAAPIPFLGGSWTAALVAFVFGIAYRRAILFIFIGTAIQGLIILIGTYSFEAVWKIII